MKKLFTLLFVIVATTALWAEDFEVNGIYYYILTDKTNEVAVTYGSPLYTGSVTIPSTVTYNGTTYSVTSIGGRAFYLCSGLTSVTIPNSVTSIGRQAFYYCTGLTPITIPNSVTSIGDEAFYYCTGLTSITIPNSVTSIGEHAFYNCSGLTSVTIPNSVTSIGEYAFYNCSGLPVENNLRYADTYLVGAVDKTLSTYSIKKGTKWIGTSAFSSCSGLTSITIPNSVTSIGENAFYDCSGLTSVTIPNSVMSIGEGAFCKCSGLTSVTIGNSVTSIGEYAFVDCSGLTSITIPNSVTSIGEYAFCYCSGLTSITSLAEVPPSLGNSAFYNVSTKTPVYVCAVSAYQSAEGWKAFTNIQEPLVEYSIAVGVNDSIMGTAKVDYNTYCEGAQITAIANYRYRFVQWSDGNTDNPRTLELTQDTILTAEFAVSYSGQCGDNLYWAYDEDSKKISITGSGDMYDYTKSTQPWLLFLEQITEVTTSNTTSSIGTSAFEGCVRLSKVSLGYGMGNIAANAFAECKRLYDIYCYATYPPFAEESSFANYNVYLYVPCENQRDYILDVVWGDFKYIECIGAESDDMGGDDVTITPGTNDVTITWPTEDDADTYSIMITKDGEVFCTLTFNSNGQLVSIAFAPGREGNHPAQYAEAAANGYRFTVTGLNESTKYAYNLDVKDDSNKTIKSYEGEFTTNSATGVEDVVISDGTTQKLLRDGKLLIIRDGKTYNAQGAAL